MYNTMTPSYLQMYRGINNNQILKQNGDKNDSRNNNANQQQEQNQKKETPKQTNTPNINTVRELGMKGKNVKVHLEIETGMNRTGNCRVFPKNQYNSFV